MEARPKLTRGAIAASVVLTIAVLGLFLRLQEYGPESALRKFHQAIEKRSLKDVQKVTAEDVNSPQVRKLMTRLAAYMAASGNHFRILRTDRTRNQVRAAVAYPLSGNSTTYIVWVVDRRGRSWVVSAEGTERVLEDALGFRP